MAAVNLPDNPANGTTSTVNGITYTYNSSKGYWTAASSGGGGGGGGGASVTTDDSAPGSPSDGDLWYDTDDGGMFVYYQDTDSSQWVEVIGSQGSPGPAGAAGATTAGVASVYATVDALPTSGNTQGDMAHVTANNTLYFWNGSGWYRIALINTNPSISGVASAYALASDGTATTVTMTATDPEGLPITYSIASDTSGNIATVSQGTGSNTNVFTITPSTNTAYAGSFTLTFRASDGVNIATAPATFTLQFKIASSNYTTALITTSGSAGTNSTFTDSSSNNHTITAAGNATQTTFSPYRHGGYSTHFDGNGDRLEMPQTTVIGTNDFTIEAWVYPEGFGDTECIFCTIPSGSSTSIQLNVAVGGALELWYKGVQTTDRVSISNVFTLNTWHHIAVVGDGTANEIKIYKNGTQIGSTISYDYNYSASGNMKVGTNRSGATYFDGYLRDVRLVHSKVYTANFTPPTEPLTAITNTKLLTCHLPYIIDGSSDANAITVYGDTSTEPFSPYDYEEYAVGDYGGSADFDGNGDYLQAPSGAITSQNNSAGFNFSSGAWTWEAWVYASSLTSPASPHIFTSRYNSTYRSSFYYNSSASQLTYWSNGSARITGPALKTNQWYHVALSSDGTTTTMWVNGESKGTTTHMQSNYDQTMYVGAAVGSGVESAGYWNGNITDARVVKGTQVYTSNFTPPTSPLTAITNTSLLLNMQGAKIFDKAQGANQIVLQNGAVSSTAQYKYLPTSMYFDGTNDSLKVHGGLGQFRTKDFTIELWAYASAIGSYAYLIEARNPSSQNNAWTLSFNYMGNVNNNILQFATFNGSTATAFLTSNTAFPTGTWKHIAVARSGTTMKMFFDGTEVASNSSAGFDFTLNQNPIYIGTRFNGTNYFNGYMSDIRITKGLARYTANFTPPAAALKG